MTGCCSLRSSHFNSPSPVQSGGSNFPHFQWLSTRSYCPARSPQPILRRLERCNSVSCKDWIPAKFPYFAPRIYNFILMKVPLKDISNIETGFGKSRYARLVTRTYNGWFLNAPIDVGMPSISCRVSSSASSTSSRCWHQVLV